MKVHQKEVPATSALLVATDYMSATVTPNCSAEGRPHADTQSKEMSRNTIIFHEDFQDSLLCFLPQVLVHRVISGLVCTAKDDADPYFLSVQGLQLQYDNLLSLLNILFIQSELKLLLFIL